MSRLVTLLSLALASARSRWMALTLVLFSIALSAALLATAGQMRADARTSFSQAVSGVDLIVGPKGSPSELLLYTVFQLGRATRNIDAARWREIQDLPMVDWVIPIQLGDTYRGHPVWGTDAQFFQHFEVQGRPVALAEGRAFDARISPYEIVLGADLAVRQGLGVGDRMVLTHGAQQLEGPLSQDHADSPFVVVGVLKPMGGPVDRAALVSLEGFEAVHQGAGASGGGGLAAGLMSMMQEAMGLNQSSSSSNLQPTELTALWVGLQSRLDVFEAVEAIESLGERELMAVLPGVALDELWRVLSVAEQSLALIGLLTAVASALSVAAVLLVALGARRRELAIYRAVGLSQWDLLGLILLEAAMCALLGILLGLSLHQLGLSLLAEVMRVDYGIVVSQWSLPLEAWQGLGAILLAAVAAALVPAWMATRLSLADGLNPPSA